MQMMMARSRRADICRTQTFKYYFEYESVQMANIVFQIIAEAQRSLTQYLARTLTLLHSLPLATTKLSSTSSLLMPGIRAQLACNYFL